MSRKVLFFLFMVIASRLAGQGVAGKHVVIVYPVVDAIQGSYLFMVSNESGTPEKYKMALKLPEETIDWAPQEGLLPKEISLGKDGQIIIEKSFPAGDSIYSVGFRVPASGDTATITVKPAANLGNLSFFVPDGKMRVLAKPEGFMMGKPAKFGGKEYITYAKNDVKSADSVSITLKGVYFGRSSFYWLGAVFTAALLILSCLFGYKTVPKESSSN